MKKQPYSITEKQSYPYIVEIVMNNDPESHLFAFKTKKDAIAFWQECEIKYRYDMKSCQIRVEKLITKL